MSMTNNIIDYYADSFQSNSFIIVNLYYYLDLNSLIKLLHTNKRQYKNHKLIYSIIFGYLYNTLILFSNIHINLNPTYGYINKKDYLFITHNENKYKLYGSLYYYINFTKYYSFIYKTCKQNKYLYNKVKPQETLTIIYGFQLKNN